MKSGTYKVSFYVELNDCTDQEHAEQEVAALVNEALEEDNFPEVEFELTEEADLEYTLEEDEVEELDFEEVI